ncbi:MAG: LysR family transcriptional regulator [Fimbriimonadaceae bacterium]|nr:LysR family transcriptional regulator [Alphaproteobacteria bacterium]
MAMDWDKVRIFHAAAQAGSFTAAGASLGLSQSAVSRQVSGLEEELKVALFHRHARGLLLTEQGERLYRSAQEISSKLQTARAMLMDSKEKPFGDLRITTTVGFGSSWLTPRLSEFIELYPGIRLQLRLHDSLLDIAMREADVAIWLQPPTQPDLIQRKLFTVHFHIFASPEYLNRYGHPSTLEELDKHNIITFGVPVPDYLRDINWLETVGRPDGEPREAVLSINNVHGLRRAVEEGIGIATLPDYLIPKNSSLVQLLPEAKAPEFDTYFAYPEELRNSKRIIVFRDFILAQSSRWKY